MNKVILIGNLTRDPELSQTNSGISVCKFSLAVQRRFSGADGERTADFFNIIVWRAQGENCHKYLRKGNKAAVVGTLQTRTYDANDGTKRYVTEIIADEVEFLTPKGGQDGGYEGSYGGGYGGDEGEPRRAPKKAVAQLEPVEDDDLPF